MKYLKISNSNQYVMVDDWHYERCKLFTWRLVGAKGNFSIHATIGGNSIPLANFIMKTADTFIEYDHIDRNYLNNLTENLRKCTRSQNSANKEKYDLKNPTSKFKGVSYRANKNKWRCRIMKDYKEIYTKTHSTEIAAALDYNRKALELFGEFAVLNKFE